ncbi:MAG TPA: VWA domain-containing protein [Acidimicrobiales bacterium]|nr:VWA domain-containing protein [Acidimicrobiales bacterium]
MADQTGPGAAGNGAGPGDGSTPPGAGGPPDDRSAPRPASAGEQAGITAGRHDRQAGSGRAPGTEGRRAADGASDGAGRAPVSADQAAQRLASIGAGVALTELLAGFIVELRSAGLPVSLTENLDAMAAIQHIPLDDRDAFKYALGATLVKNAAHWRVFETVFEVYFSLRGREYALSDEQAQAMADLDELLSEMPEQQGDQQGAGGVGDSMTPEELAQMLMKALSQGNEALLRALARQAVRRYAGMEPGRPVGGTYYLYRTLRNLDLDGVLDKLMQQAREQAPEPLTPLEERLERAEYESRVDQLRKEIEAEIRRRLVADRGVEAMARTLRKPLPEDVDFMHASREEMASLRKAIYPLTRKLAVRLARKRRHGRKGPLDFRSTVRQSLSTGGVPMEPRFRYPRPSKPEIFVVADISGSVAAFARFTLHLVYAISNQFSKVRSFVFIDGIDEVTRLFEGTEDIGEAVHRVNTEADVIWVDGHSDYGHAFEVFWQRYGKDVGPKTTVLLLGDARNNYHATQSWVVREMQHRARHVYWLNPEPRSYWDTGDSIIGEYATFCDGVFECRNLRQLERFVDHLV